MREIVHLQVGQCGNQIGEKFWDNILAEHGLDRNGKYQGKSPLELRKIDVYFNTRDDGLYAPRAVLIDTEPSAVESVTSGRLRTLFSSGNVVVRDSGAGSNWAKGHFLLGSELLEPAMEVIRKEVERCDSLQGLQITHSLGGGTGSGFGSLLLESLRQDYPDRILNSFATFPSSDVSNNVVEPYNAVLATESLIEHADAVHVIDNKALGDITKNILKLPNPTFDDYNDLISQSMAGSTCSLRFPGPLNSDLRKLCVNLTPFPRLHFFASTSAPLVTADSTVPTTVAMLVNQMFNPKHTMCRAGAGAGRLLTASVVFRGKVSTKDVDEQVRLIQEKESLSFVEWIPNNIKKCICDVPPVGKSMAATFLGNSTGTQTLIHDITSQFSVMLRRRAFLHWYTAEGVDEDQLLEAEGNLYDLVAEYKQYENGLSTEDDDSCSVQSEVTFDSNNNNNNDFPK